MSDEYILVVDSVHQSNPYHMLVRLTDREHAAIERALVDLIERDEITMYELEYMEKTRTFKKVARDLREWYGARLSKEWSP